MQSTLLQSLFIALFIGIASGTIGAFIILKRMALVGDALSHVALPGIALALAYQWDVFWGAIVFLIIAAIVIWVLEAKTSVPTDALIGLLFTTSLAIGILLIPNSDIIESLLGGFQRLSSLSFVLVLGAAGLAIVFSYMFAGKFLFSILASDLARVGGIQRSYDLILYLILGSVVALGIKLVGTLLMGALVIIPASIAKNISRSTRGYILLSSLLGGFLSEAGLLIATKFKLLPGPMIIFVGVGIFLVSVALSNPIRTDTSRQR